MKFSLFPHERVDAAVGFGYALRTSLWIKTTKSKPGGCQDSNNLSPLDPSLWNSPLGRRSFLKKSGKAGAATVLAMNGLMFEVLASESTQKYVKLTRVVQYTNGLPGNYTGSGSATLSETVGNDVDMAKKMALARAVNDLLEQLKAASRFTTVSDTPTNGWVPTSYKLLHFYKTADGEAAPGKIEFTSGIPDISSDNPFYIFEPDEVNADHAYTCVVHGHLVGTSGTITFRWIWG